MKKKYNLEYFLKEPEFIRWIKNPDEELSDFWCSFIEKHPDNKKEIAEAAEIIRALKVKKEIPDEELKREILNEIIARNSLLALERSKRSNGYFINILKYAAILFSILGCIFIYQYFLENSETENLAVSQVSEVFAKAAPLGTKVQTKLPDGTDVWINSGSRLTYSENKVLHTRNVMLEGEAFFEVTKDASRPFVVKTQFVSVKALGTSFNVRAYKNTSKSEVTLLTGKVAVAQLKDTLSILELLPGEKAVIEKSDNELKKQASDYISDFGWKDGVLSFKNADFKEVKEKLEKWYGVDINVSDMRRFCDWTIDGQYDNQSLELVLKHLSYTKNFEFRIVDNKVYLNDKK